MESLSFFVFFFSFQFEKKNTRLEHVNKSKSIEPDIVFSATLTHYNWQWLRRATVILLWFIDFFEYIQLTGVFARDFTPLCYGTTVPFWYLRNNHHISNENAAQFPLLFLKRNISYARQRKKRERKTVMEKRFFSFGFWLTFSLITWNLVGKYRVSYVCVDFENVNNNR